MSRFIITAFLFDANANPAFFPVRREVVARTPRGALRKARKLMPADSKDFHAQVANVDSGVVTILQGERIVDIIEFPAMDLDRVIQEMEK